MPSKSKYASTESASCLLVNELAKRIKNHLVKNGAASKANSDDLLDKLRAGLESIEVEGQRFVYTSKRNHLGGARWFASCPKCGAQCVKLFKPDHSSLGRENRYLCAKCHGLKSPSALYGPTSKYRDVVKPLKRMMKIRETIRTSKKLSDDDTRGLMKEHEQLKEAMLASAVYQRLKFKLEAEGLLKGIAL